GQLAKLPNVELALESEVETDEVLGYDFRHVAISTGARWRDDGVGRWHTRPPAFDPSVETLTPDDLISGSRPPGERSLPFADDPSCLGGVLAELLAAEGKRVTLVTPAPRVSEWSVNTMEHERIHRRLVDAGIELATARALVAVEGGTARLADVYSRREHELLL